MPNDPFYKTAAWLALRAAALMRDGHRCVSPGCGRPATIVDHVMPRAQGGADALGNLRSLCPTCDNQAKERGGRRGQIRVRPRIGPDGWPVKEGG